MGRPPEWPKVFPSGRWPEASRGVVSSQALGWETAGAKALGWDSAPRLHFLGTLLTAQGTWPVPAGSSGWRHESGARHTAS